MIIVHYTSVGLKRISMLILIAFLLLFHLVSVNLGGGLKYTILEKYKVCHKNGLESLLSLFESVINCNFTFCTILVVSATATKRLGKYYLNS